jgi:hypothetical protein
LLTDKVQYGDLREVSELAFQIALFLDRVRFRQFPSKSAIRA